MCVTNRHGSGTQMDPGKDPDCAELRRSSLCVATPTGHRFMWHTLAMIPESPGWGG